MTVYRCRFCGSICDEEKEGVPISGLEVCSVCMITTDRLVKVEDGGVDAKAPDRERGKPVKRNRTREACQDCSGGTGEAAAHDPEYIRMQTDACYVDKIHEMAVKGQSTIVTMGTQMLMLGWDDILFLGAQLNSMPPDEHAPVKAETIIGKHAAKPMVLDHPVYISHMSFGALSRETKAVLSRGSVMARIAIRPDEGGILLEEKTVAYKYILEYVPNQHDVADEGLREADAIEIKIGQDTELGTGDRLPGGKATSEIMAIRNGLLGQDVINPSRLPGIGTKEDLRALADRLRLASGGRSIGIEITARGIKRDLEFCVYTGPGFIIIDGGRGATGAGLKIIRDSTSILTVCVFYRARRYLNQAGREAQLMITGGLRVSSDFAKALAMGVDATTIASVALMAVACQQYRICGTGMCPVGVATQGKKLCSYLKEDVTAQKVANFLRVSLEEIKTFTRIMGYNNIHGMDADDLCTVSRKISGFINIRHA